SRSSPSDPWKRRRASLCWRPLEAGGRAMAQRAAARTARSAGKVDPVVEATRILLADTYTLYLKTHNFHWNVTGPMFTTLHTLFETQYTELALAVDEIAERIRALGHVAPGSYAEFAQLANVKDAPTRVPKAQDMIRQLVR